MRPFDDGKRADIGAVAEILRRRAPLMELLADAPRDQRDLRDELDLSRSAVYKSLQRLQEADLVADRGGGYELTGFGRLAWQRHDDYIARLDRLDTAKRLLETLPDDRPLPLELFEQGRITVPGRHAPERPLDRLSDFGERSRRLRVLSPSGMPRFLRDIHTNVEAGEQTATIVTEGDAISRLRTGYERFEEAATAAGLDIYEFPRELPYAIVLFDTEYIGLFGYEDGLLVGAAFADGTKSISWGERVFERALVKSDRV